ncbi:hypothetical protein HYZ70_03015 [Candidatus Curtissbacteria bacterium]|nr:hypothetical protein [Candidatus Curtissbacteria bacterium]
MKAEGLVPVPPESAFKKIIARRQFLITALAIVIVGSVVFVLHERPHSRIQIKAQKDKFKAEFVLTGPDRAKAEKFLEKLALPKSVLQDQEFELDGTSAARLAFASPVILDVNLTGRGITFSGESHIPLAEANLALQPAFKLPASTNLVIFSHDFRQIFKKHFVAQQLNVWIDQNLSSQGGQYLTLFTPDANFALSFKAQKPLDTAALEQIAMGVGQDAYKEESVDDTVIHLIKVSEKEETTLAIFELDDWLHVTTSLESAKQLLAVQQGNAPFINLPKTNKNVSFAIYFKKGESINADSFSPITPNSPKVAKYLENIKEALIMLDREKISGYIDFDLQ